MNNIQKAFKAKAQLGLRMASGGLIDQPDLISQGNSLMDSIRGNSNLSQRQKLQGLSAAGGELAQLGVKPNDPTFGLSGLSGRQRMHGQLQNFGNTIDAAKAGAPVAADTGGLGSIGGTPVLQDKKPALADGGVVAPKETPDQLMARMAAKYGAPAAGRHVPTPVVQAPATPAPTPAPAPQKPTMMEGLRRALDPRERERAAGLAEGGIVRGPGGPTDDAVPMRVNGKDVNLSNTEAVLPAKTVDALGGPEAVEELIEKTNGKPPSKAGLRAGGNYANGGTFYTDDGTGGRRYGAVPGTPTPALPPPEPGTAVSVRPTIDRTGYGGARIDPAGSIHGEAVRVTQAPQLSAPVIEPAQPAPPRSDLPYRAGQAVGKGVEWLKNNKAKALGVAGDIYSVYNANDTASKHDPFYNSEQVSTLDKGLQAGRDIARSGLPLVGGAIGTGVGTVASPTVVANPVTGSIAGTVLGAWASHMIDPEGEALKKFNAGRQGSDVRAAHDKIMAGDTSGTIALPITAADKVAAKKATAAAQLEANPNVKILRDAGNNGAITGDVTENGKTAATGIRTIDGANGQKIYAGRDKNGHLIVNSGMEMSAGQADATHDAEFAKAGYGKDAYGNWMSPQRLGDKQALNDIQRERARFDAFDSSITDPNARASGLRRVADFSQQDAAAALVKQHDAELGLRRAMLEQHGLDRGERAREFNVSQETARMLAQAAASEKKMKDVDSLIDTEDFGDKTKNVRWKDFARANFVGGVGSDGKPTKGLEGLDANQARNQLPILKAKFEMNERAQAGALDKTTLKDISGGSKRDVTLKDIDWNAWGMPDLTDSGDHHRMSVEEYLHRKLDPRYSGQLYVDPNGNRYRIGDVRGKAASLGSGDVDELLNGK